MPRVAGRVLASAWGLGYDEAVPDDAIYLEQMELGPMQNFVYLIGDPQAREIVYGMPYEEWKAKHQKDASGEQQKAFAETHKH